MAVNQSIFGATPDELQMAREQALQQQALQYAQLNPFQQASMGMFMAGNRVGGAFGGDPQTNKLRALQELAKKHDITTAAGLTAFAQDAKTIDANAALAAISKAKELKKAEADALDVDREEAMRKELAGLPPDASQDDVLKIVQKYASGDKLLTTMQGAQDKKAAREQALLVHRESIEAKVEAAKAAAEAKIEAAREAGATRLQIAQMQVEARQTIAQLQIEGRKSIAALAQSLKTEGPEKLTSSDIKQINDAQQHATSASNNAQQAQSFIDRIDKGEIKISPKENLYGAGRTLLGNSTASDQAKAELRQFVERSSAEVLRMDVGVKTEGDAQRAKQQVLDALGKNDPKVVSNSLRQYMNFLKQLESIQKDKVRTISEVRRRPELAPKEAETPKVIKLD